MIDIIHQVKPVSFINQGKTMRLLIHIPSMLIIMMLVSLIVMPSIANAQQVSASGSGPTKAYACVEANNRMASIANAGNSRVYRHDGCSCTKSEVDNGGAYRFQCKATGLMGTGTGGKMVSASGNAPSVQAACTSAKNSAENIARSGGLQVAQYGGCSCEDTHTNPAYTSSSKTCMVDAYAEPLNKTPSTQSQVSTKIGDVTNRDLCVEAAYIHMTRTMTGIVKRRTTAVKEHILAKSDVEAKALFRHFDSKLASGEWNLNDIRNHIEKCGVHHRDLAF